MPDYPAIKARLREMGCGDNSCSSVQHTGMGTNGGCRCLESVTDREARHELRTLLQLRRAQAEMLDDLLDKLRYMSADELVEHALRKYNHDVRKT